MENRVQDQLRSRHRRGGISGRTAWANLANGALNYEKNASILKGKENNFLVLEGRERETRNDAKISKKIRPEALQNNYDWGTTKTIPSIKRSWRFANRFSVLVR